MRCNAEFYYVGKITLIGIGLQRRVRGFTTVLFTASRRNNFVGGTCALPSALLVFILFSHPSLLQSFTSGLKLTCIDVKTFLCFIFFSKNMF